MHSEDELKQSIVPKIEREFPSVLEIDHHMLPAIKEWKVGERYMIKLSVQNVESTSGSLTDPNNKAEFRSKFRVLGAQDISYDDAGRAVVKPMARMLAKSDTPVNVPKSGKNNLSNAFARFFAALMGE